MGNNCKTKKISIIFIFLLVYLLIFTVSIEFIGRKEDMRQINQYFNYIKADITYIYKTGSEEILHSYLDNLITNPYIRYIICYKNGEAENLYTREEHIDFKKIDKVFESKIDIGMKAISQEGHILLGENGGGHSKDIYLNVFKNRNYSLLSGAMGKIILVNFMVVILIILLFTWLIDRRLLKPLDRVNKFIYNLSIGDIPDDMKINNPKLENTVKSLYEIREQLIYMYRGTDKVDEEVVTDMLDIVEDVIKIYSRHNKICINITETICRKVTKAVCCSLWLGDLDETTRDLKIHRGSIYYFEDQFPVEGLTPLARELAREVMEDRKVKIVNDFQMDTQYKDFKEAHPLAVIVIPVQVKGTIIGSLCIWKTRIPYSEVFNLKTQQLANYLGKVTGSIIEGCNCQQKLNFMGKAVE